MTESYTKEDSMTSLVAAAEIDIAAPASAVWQALTDPAQIKEYFLGATVETDWKPGSPGRANTTGSRSKTRGPSSRSSPSSCSF
jgi:uncharacterized protein YndB with AHSA1/START domain